MAIFCGWWRPPRSPIGGRLDEEGLGAAVAAGAGGRGVAAACGASVAAAGSIGFVGIVVPHLLRLAIGPSHRFLLPASALGGAALLLLADSFARTVAAPAELPIGVVTALIGAPVFLFLLLGRGGFSMRNAP